VVDIVSTEVLKGFKLFTGLDETELAQIATLCQERTYERDAIIFTAGGWATDVYVLKSGRVGIQIELVIYNLEIRAIIYTVEKGEVFGWSAIVPPHRLTALARCLEEADVVVINGTNFMNLLQKNNHIGYVVMKNLSLVISSRLAATTTTLCHEIQKLLKK